MPVDPVLFFPRLISLSILEQFSPHTAALFNVTANYKTSKTCYFNYLTTMTSNKILMNIEEKREKIRYNYETIAVLREETQRQTNGMKRSAYVKMILDTTKKVDKQNVELTKVILETRALQRDISQLNGRLGRIFALVEDTIMREAKDDAWSRDCYRLLNLMHENCDQLVRAVEETGVVTREIRQLEDQIDKLRVPSV